MAFSVFIFVFVSVAQGASFIEEEEGGFLKRRGSSFSKGWGSKNHPDIAPERDYSFLNEVAAQMSLDEKSEILPVWGGVKGSDGAPLEKGFSLELPSLATGEFSKLKTDPLLLDEPFLRRQRSISSPPKRTEESEARGPSSFPKGSAEVRNPALEGNGSLELSTALSSSLEGMRRKSLSSPLSKKREEEGLFPAQKNSGTDFLGSQECVSPLATTPPKEPMASFRSMETAGTSPRFVTRTFVIPSPNSLQAIDVAYEERFPNVFGPPTDKVKKGLFNSFTESFRKKPQKNNTKPIK